MSGRIKPLRAKNRPNRGGKPNDHRQRQLAQRRRNVANRSPRFELLKEAAKKLDAEKQS